MDVRVFLGKYVVPFFGSNLKGFFWYPASIPSSESNSTALLDIYKSLQP